MREFNTTTECLQEAREVLQDAKGIKTREQHARVWDRKVRILNVINDAFQTGYHTGKAYDELREAQSLLLTAESIAGNMARETYSREL